MHGLTRASQINKNFYAGPSLGFVNELVRFFLILHFTDFALFIVLEISEVFVYVMNLPTRLLSDTNSLQFTEVHFWVKKKNKKKLEQSFGVTRNSKRVNLKT